VSKKMPSAVTRPVSASAVYRSLPPAAMRMLPINTIALSLDFTSNVGLLERPRCALGALATRTPFM
jgi:hypothetical protein